MILNEKELDALITTYENKSEEAYRNYQDTGYSRYWNAHKKYEDMADTLKVARDSKTRYVQCMRIASDMKQWAGTISQMPYMTQERKDQETLGILNEIVENAKWL